MPMPPISRAVQDSAEFDRAAGSSRPGVAVVVARDSESLDGVAESEAEGAAAAAEAETEETDMAPVESGAVEGGLVMFESRLRLELEAFVAAAMYWERAAAAAILA